METITCQRCKRDNAPVQERAPFKSELGERLREAICSDCWKDWLKHQTALINHYGLDPRDAEAREFLYAQVEEVLLGSGEAKQVDSSKQGEIEW